MDDWTELKKNETEHICLRSSRAIGIAECSFNAEDNLPAHARILYDSGESAKDIRIAEPYEQVKRKIIGGEEDKNAELFTREEYENLLGAVNAALRNSKNVMAIGGVVAYTDLKAKISNILKEIK